MPKAGRDVAPAALPSTDTSPVVVPADHRHGERCAPRRRDHGIERRLGAVHRLHGVPP